ncbi:MAG TPA: flagellar protein FlgN [Candidatus Competibacter sp.]|nr:flagellar protein FlgN [Candidatus Competibacter sp.]
MTLAMLLREELTAVEWLQQLLQREYDVLKTRDPASLEQVVNEKQACTDRLRKLMADRVDYLQAQGIAADAQGLAAYVDTLPVAERIGVDQLWTALEKVAEQVRAQNEVNGAVIAASRNHVDRTLAILRGRDSLDFLYDQDTRKVFGGGGQPIARA